MKFSGPLWFDYPLRICQLFFDISMYLFPAKFDRTFSVFYQLLQFCAISSSVSELPLCK